MDRNEPMSRAELLSALTATHEKTIRPALFNRRPVLIREITARQRLIATQAAQAENPDDPDNALYQAMLIQSSVVDPNSGTTDPLTGRIDPRTRKPLLTVADVESIANGREIAVRLLVDEITGLAGLQPVALFPGDSSAHGPERDAGEGDPGGGDGIGESAGEGAGDDGRGAAVPDEPAGGPGESGSVV